MLGTEMDEEFDLDFRTHGEILELIEEIRELERKYPSYEIIEPEPEELIEVEHEEEPYQWVPAKHVKKKRPPKIKGIKPPSKIKLPKIKILRRKSQEELNPATFKLRIGEDGSLKNLDFRAPKQKSESKFSLKKILNKIPLKRGKKGEKEAKSSEEKSKLGKLKGGFGKIGKLKKLIPQTN